MNQYVANSLEKYRNLRLRDSLSTPYRYPKACKELSVILRTYFSQSPKPVQSLLFDDTLFAFRLLPLMQTQSAVSAARLLIQSAESAFPKQKRALAASEFKQAKIAYKRRGKIQLNDKVPVNLPQDVLVHLFSLLDLQSLLSASSVCWSWNAAAGDNYLWQLMYTNYFDDSQSTLKLVGLADDETAIHKQDDELSSEVCDKVNQNWKDYFTKAYLGSPCKSERGYCSYCDSIVLLSYLKCPNQGLGQSANKHELETRSPDEIGKYIVEGDYDSDSDEVDPYFSRGRHEPTHLSSESDSDWEYSSEGDSFFTRGRHEPTHLSSDSE